MKIMQEEETISGRRKIENMEVAPFDGKRSRTYTIARQRYGLTGMLSTHPFVRYHQNGVYVASKLIHFGDVTFCSFFSASVELKYKQNPAACCEQITKRNELMTDFSVVLYLLFIVCAKKKDSHFVCLSSHTPLFICLRILFTFV